MSEEKKETIEVIEPELVTSITHSGKSADIMSNIENMSAERAIEILEKKSKITKALRDIAIRNTSNKRGWVSLGNNMYASDSVVSVIVRDCGISHETLDISKKQSEDARGKYYIYVATVRAFHPWIGEVVRTGVATQRDKFFAFANGEWKKDTDIPESNIMKKAETNAIGRCVREMLGINDLTRDEINKGAGATVDYGKGKKQQQGNGTQNGDAQNGEQKAPLDKDKLINMHATLMDGCGNNELLYSEVVKIVSNEFAGFKGNYNVKNITSEKWRQKFVIDYGKKQLKDWISEAESALEKEPVGEVGEDGSF